MADSSDAAVLADLAQLKLEQGDAEGAKRLFRQALEQQQQAGTGQVAEQAAAADGEEDDWEAWDEASVPVAAAPPKEDTQAADSWGSSGAAGAASRSSSRPSRSSTAAAPAAAAAAAAAAPSSRGTSAAAEEAADEQELQFGGGHVLELYGLTPAVRTQHLEAFLERFALGHAAPPTLKWVDDCHAAVSCSDPAAARQLLAAATAAGAAAEFKLRGYADAGSGTRKLPGSELLPPKPRPKTSAAVARRLIGGALNLRGLRDRDAEQQLTAARRQQRQEREQRQKALDAAWDD